MKKLWMILFLILVAGTAKADLITYNDIWGSGTDAHETITNARLNGWNTAIKNWANGLIDYVNIKPLGIRNSNIANLTIQVGKFECSSTWATLSGCSSVVNADATHIHSAAAITFATGTAWSSTTTNLQAAVDALGTYVGYSSNTASFSTTTYQMVFSGIAVDDTTVYTGGTPATPTILMTVATGTATGGIAVDLSAYIAVTGVPLNAIGVPLCINGVGLSYSGHEVKKYETTCGEANATVICNNTKKIVYRTADGWDPAVANTVSICSPYLTAGSAAAGQVENFSLALYLLR